MTNPCAREDCPATITEWMRESGYLHCSPLCFCVDEQLTKLEASARAANPNNERITAAYSEAWATLVLAADAISAHQQSMTVVRESHHAARRRRGKRTRKPVPTPLDVAKNRH